MNNVADFVLCRSGCSRRQAAREYWKKKKMISKEACIKKYKEFKKEYGRIPKLREFLKYAVVQQRVLIKFFGDDAYSKLQVECGDIANKLILERTPREKLCANMATLY